MSRTPLRRPVPRDIGGDVDISILDPLEADPEATATGENSIALGLNDAESLGSNELLFTNNGDSITYEETPENNKIVLGSDIDFDGVSFGDSGGFFAGRNLTVGDMHNVVIGSEITASGASTFRSENVVIGKDINTNNTSTDNSVLIGANITSGNNGSRNTAIGRGATVNESRSIAIGSLSATDTEPEATAEDAIAIGTDSKATASDTIAIGGGKTPELGAISIGAGSETGDVSSVSLGRNSRAIGRRSIAIGRSADATDNGSLALGLFSEATGSSSIAIGRSVDSTGEESIAIGRVTASQGDNSIAIGELTTVEDNKSIHITTKGEDQTFSGANKGLIEIPEGQIVYTSKHGVYSETDMQPWELGFDVNPDTTLTPKFKDGEGNTGEEIKMQEGGNGVILTTPDETQEYRIRVDNNGNITTEQV